MQETSQPHKTGLLEADHLVLLGFPAGLMCPQHPGSARGGAGAEQPEQIFS